MAIFHLSARKPIARSAGRSATAAAAYRSGQRIVDERTGQAFDFRRRRGVLGATLILPGCIHVSDRAGFWNAVEHHHRRKDAVVAREIVVALPIELDERGRQALALEFAAAISNEYEVGVDCALHAPSVDGDDRNYHAHLLLTTCRVGSDATLGKKSERLDPIHCRRSGIADSVAWLRPRWSELVNAALEAARLDVRVDHRSLAARGIAQVPTVHVGPRHRSAPRKARNRRVRATNAVAKDLTAQIARLLAERQDLAARLGKADGEIPAPEQPMALPISLASPDDYNDGLEQLREVEEMLGRLPAGRPYDRMRLRSMAARLRRGLEDCSLSERECGLAKEPAPDGRPAMRVRPARNLRK
jgi:hypothetical protein